MSAKACTNFVACIKVETVRDGPRSAPQCSFATKLEGSFHVYSNMAANSHATTA